MRRLAAFAVLLLVVACQAPPPEPSLIDGTYDLYSRDGEVWEWWGSEDAEFSWEFRADSTLLNTANRPDMAGPAISTGSYSVTGIEEGCLGASMRLEIDPNNLLLARICGDTMTASYRGQSVEWVYIKRR